MTGVWLIRHGEAAAPAGVAIGSTDPGLSELGRLQAERLAVRLASARLTRVFSSDLQRAVETARPIAARHRLPVETTAELREIDFGVWEGRPLSGLWIEEPAVAEAWEADIRSTPASFGESFADFENRVIGWWRRAGAALSGEIAIVAHGGSLALLRSAIGGAAVGASIDLKVGLGEAQVIRFEPAI
jgi:broad specificity phosphatase PhoE